MYLPTSTLFHGREAGNLWILARQLRWGRCQWKARLALRALKARITNAFKAAARYAKKARARNRPARRSSTQRKAMI